MGLRQSTVLVVDDDEHFCAFLSALLESAGYQTLATTRVEDAADVARDTHVDAAILDVVMPGRGGYSLCEELRREVDPQLPVIFVSGERVDPMDRAAGIIAGGDDYLVKPVHPEELLARLRRLLDRSLTLAPNPAEDLSEREIEILQLIAEGDRPAEIAEQLFIAPKTVSSHIQRIFLKLGVHTRAQAVALAYEAGLIRVDPARVQAARPDVEAHFDALEWQPPSAA